MKTLRFAQPYPPRPSSGNNPLSKDIQRTLYDLPLHDLRFLILTSIDQMHRARHAVPPLSPHDPQTRDWNFPRIRFAVLSHARLDIQGPFEQEARVIVELASRVSGRPPPQRDGCVIVPVYDLQVENIRAKFPDVEILDKEFSIPVYGQASIRCVSPIMVLLRSLLTIVVEPLSSLKFPTLR
jgi:hypothetical protein